MILDTNAYTALAKGLPGVISAIKNADQIYLPLPVIAELRFGFRKGSYSDQNEQTLQRFLAQPQVSILTPTLETTSFYASIQLICQKRGKALSHNDIWVAALAQEADDILATYDKDFTVLTEVLGKNLLILR